ncbi:transcription initiation protein SPT3 homolog [Trichogramma pretiosum]|uniref:transcription initiation protein SPT3 homolog n=1 Tax=Trichogramma pretiosum TaxID=7493 RepID=UPI0006C9B8EB|nr:transcription initiation protein SPT3 homolog [Trichogramma pretiosum]
MTSSNSKLVGEYAEIRQMMHGFGDHAEPLVETAKLVDEVVNQQMRSMLRKACEVAATRESSMVGMEDFLFLLRKDKVKLHRMLNYLKIKEFKAKMSSTLDGESPLTSPNPLQLDLNHKAPYMKFLKSIDNTGQLLNAENVVDYTKQKRIERIDRMTQDMDRWKYLEFSRARCATFSLKKSNKFNKFNEWIAASGDMPLHKSAYTALSYLAYETIGQIVDLAFLVRRDQNKINGDPIDRLRTSYPNPYTYKPYQYHKAISIKPLTPAEVQEALRRYWSPQLEMTGPFQRWTYTKPELKLLTC